MFFNNDPLLTPADRRVWCGAVVFPPPPGAGPVNPPAFALNVSLTSDPGAGWQKFYIPLPACEMPPVTMAPDSYWHIDSFNLAVESDFVYLNAIARDPYPTPKPYRNVTYILSKSSLLSGQVNIVGKVFEPPLHLPPALMDDLFLGVEDTLAVRYTYDDSPQYYVTMRAAETPQTHVDLGHMLYFALPGDPCVPPGPADPAPIMRLPLPLPAPYLEPENIDQPQLFDPEPSFLNPFDARAWNAVYRDGSLWFCHHLTKPEAPARVVVRWYEVAMNDWGLPGGGTPVLVQWGEIDPQAMPPTPNPGERRHAFFPSIAVGPGGHMAICYNRSSNYTEWVSIRTAARTPTDPPGQLTSHATLKTSQWGWGIGPGVERWGDYSDIVPDEGEGADPCTFWTHHEYVYEPPPFSGDQRWATWVAPWSACDP